MENIILHVDCKGEALDRFQNGDFDKKMIFTGIKK